MTTSAPSIESATRERLSRIRTKLDQLRTLDSERGVFGSAPPAGHDYVERPRYDDAGIAALEARLGVSLPDELAGFLVHVHGGGPGPGYRFFVDSDEQPSSETIARPFPYGSADVAQYPERRKTDVYTSMPCTEEDDDGAWPPGPGFILVADHGCGVFDVLVVTGEQRGTVWCCDMAWRPYECGLLDWYEQWLDEALASVAR